MLQISREQLVRTALWHRNNRRAAEAAECLRQVIANQPDDAGAHHDLGMMLLAIGNRHEAEKCFREAVRLRPDMGDGYNELGNICRGRGQLEEAAGYYQKAIEAQPGLVAARANLGSVRESQGRYAEAAEHFRGAIQMAPKCAGLHLMLGTCLTQMGPECLAEALACYKIAVELDPTQAVAWYNAAFTFQRMGKLDEAMEYYRRALKLKPDLAEAWNNLGLILGLAGDHEESVACRRRAVELHPERSQIHSSLLRELHFLPKIDERTLLIEHEAWALRHAEPLRPASIRHANDRTPDRRLRVGYVSPDFRMRPVGRFILPVLEAHNREQVEVYCYADLREQDGVTPRLQAAADRWRETTGMSDEAVAEMIRGDGIDILVDLTMHMRENRLLVFARKPAPVQVTYLAYCSTTGMKAMDYRITDRFMDPPGRDLSVYTEQSVRVERYWSYWVPEDTPEINALPALAGEPITFGCLNNFSKVNSRVLDLWGKVLKEVPDSMLVLHSNLGKHGQDVKAFLERTRIEPWRCAFAGVAGILGYYSTHRSIDIALDPFPYGGRTTTCDALWMGVPVVTLAGERAVSRLAVSILSNAGFPDLIAETEDIYVDTAVRLARDLLRLGEIRRGMRDKVKASALMNGAATARGLEEAYRGMWRTWCKA